MSTANASGLPPGVEKLREMLAGAHDSGKWDSAWKAGLTPWDKGQAQAALVSTLSEAKTSELLPTSGRAVVPGMGRGYDVALLASRGLHTVGVDISPKAVEAAQQWLDSQSSAPASSQMSVRAADWFSLEPTQADSEKETDGTIKSFDLAYDYTFFCALPSTLHQKWADTYARLIKPGGKLLCLVYPIGPSSDAGPPYNVSPDQHIALLSKAFELEHHAPPSKSAPERKGKEEIMIWRRK
ncbi:THIOCYANATE METHYLTRANSFERASE 1-RELATED [Ceraceosorus bombacis]|uniref:THIOCYANATE METHYLTRANSFERASE 1-RELATED n=1 Tax=Ceraceosorus bombacis TaxID=401625 RepID=A0A0P1BNN4_9BASI|nr:THIOCYANATE METHYLTRANSFERASE 1-RELATED [Ceraceosorus bombacis]